MPILWAMAQIAAGLVLIGLGVAVTGTLLAAWIGWMRR